MFKRWRIKVFFEENVLRGGRKEAHGVDIRRREWYNEGGSAKDKSRRRHFCARFKRGESMAKVKTGVEANNFFALSTPISIETKSPVAPYLRGLFKNERINNEGRASQEARAVLCRFCKECLSNEQGREAASVKGKKKWKKRRTIGKRK